MIRRTLLFAPLFLALALPAQNSDWAGFRGQDRNGVSRDGTPPVDWDDEKNVAWRTTLPGPGSSSPIVVGDRVYIACYSGYGAYLDDGGDPEKLEHHLLCVDRKTGEEVWRQSLPGKLTDAARQVQINEHGFASPTPICDGEVVFAYFGRAGVAAFDAGDGEILWQADLGEPSADAPAATNGVERNGQTLSLRWGAAASPLLFGDTVIVNCSEESNSIRALDRKTGELVWKRESANLEGSAISPVVVGSGDEAVLIIGLGGEIWGLDPNTGEEFWTVETGTRGGMSPTPVAAGDTVYAFGGEGKSFAIRWARELAPLEGEGEAPERVRWQSENLGIPSPLLHDGRLFLVNSRGIGVCMNAADGEVTFNERLEGKTSGIYSSPVFADGRLYVVSRKRGTFVYSADGKFELLAHNEVEDDSQFNASPAIAGNQLFLRSDKYLYCIAPG